MPKEATATDQFLSIRRWTPLWQHPLGTISAFPSHAVHAT
ncbi:MAG: hypothetical protein KatS3mg111_0019 [Pirellulaceae bacterium]|nr:MAG: hypothetical protein KatS3mg111_0019 [Pirellulaceae bacterium]